MSLDLAQKRSGFGGLQYTSVYNPRLAGSVGFGTLEYVGSAVSTPKLVQKQDSRPSKECNIYAFHITLIIR